MNDKAKAALMDIVGEENYTDTLIDMVAIGSWHPAFKGMNEVLQKHTNIYAEEEPEDFERERNKKAECVYFTFPTPNCAGKGSESITSPGSLMN